MNALCFLLSATYSLICNALRIMVAPLLLLLPLLVGEFKFSSGVRGWFFSRIRTGFVARCSHSSACMHSHPPGRGARLPASLGGRASARRNRYGSGSLLMLVYQYQHDNKVHPSIRSLGFHREVVSKVSCLPSIEACARAAYGKTLASARHTQPSGAHATDECSLMLYEPLTSSVFVDLYQVQVRLTLKDTLFCCYHIYAPLHPSLGGSLRETTW